MKVILTGASGFLGIYIYNKLAKENDVITVSRAGANISTNLATEIPQLPSANLIVHCAGKAHSVPKTEEEKQAFFDVNLKGTANFLKGLEACAELPKSFVFISTVAVYGCDSGTLINENRPLNAIDPYGLSKIQAEELVQKWCAENNVICTILRLPLLVGKNPPGNLGAMIKGIKKGYYFNIAGGKAKKSMVFANDVAKIIPTVANIGGIYNLTDGYHPSFAELASSIAKTLGKKNIFNLPFWLANIMAKLGDMLGNKAPINSKKLAKITADLTFDDSKAKKELNWKPEPVLTGWK
ncbi:MAG: NAD-dependent epimerase/dehydratase family protein [Pedobacter sp.]|nr:MAG: NAD-dependent epimerase/dehydratase family protein [Pedobacter sp.]